MLVDEFPSAYVCLYHRSQVVKALHPTQPCVLLLLPRTAGAGGRHGIESVPALGPLWLVMYLAFIPMFQRGQIKCQGLGSFQK